MTGSLKIRLVNICFPAFFNFRANVMLFLLHLWKMYSLNFLLMWLKELLLHMCSVKRDEYYGMFSRSITNMAKECTVIRLNVA